MQRSRKRKVALAVVGAATAGLAALSTGAASAAPTLGITHVPTANTKAAGITKPDKLSPELTKHCCPAIPRSSAARRSR